MRLISIRTQKKTILTLAAMAALFLYPQLARSWGFWGHKAITRRAISSLPAECRAYFTQNAKLLVKHSIDPDLWRKFDKAESNRHYIDIDMFGNFPFNDLPHAYPDAVKKFGAKKIKKAGIVPWRIVEFTDSLAWAMKHKDRKLILRYASALAHYVEDVHMPLHTVKNYNGQLSGNEGIHSRYERWMLEAHKKQVAARIKPGRARRLKDVRESAFRWVLDSYVWADNLLLADTRAKTPGKTYESLDDYDAGYYDRLYELTKDFTALQMSRAATHVASCWLTAWEKAGRPNLAQVAEKSKSE